jgi:hypothetical protein
MKTQKTATKKTTAAPKDTNLGPNEKFPFGIRITDNKENISWERFKTAKERDQRISTVKGDAVDYKPKAAKPAKAAPKPAPPPAPKQPIYMLGVNGMSGVARTTKLADIQTIVSTLKIQKILDWREKPRASWRRTC